jgi:stage V sporulation protein G
MEITSVKVRLKTSGNERVKATASIIFDNCFVVNGVRVVQGNSSLFVAMPSEQVKTGDGYRDIAHPINAECRAKVHKAVMAEYEAELKKAEATSEESEAE